MSKFLKAATKATEMAAKILGVLTIILTSPFDLDAAELPPYSEEEMFKILEWLKDNPEYNLFPDKIDPCAK